MIFLQRFPEKYCKFGTYKPRNLGSKTFAMKSLKTLLRDCNARAFFEKNQYRGSDWTNSRFKGGLGKKEGVVLLRKRRGVVIPMHTMSKNAF